MAIAAEKPGHALSGIRVIDLTVWVQGPATSQLLADFGAEVIKVERCDGGDQGRGLVSMAPLPIDDWNHYFGVLNRNKKALAVDLKTVAGREIVYRLARESDVFLSNLTLDRLEEFDLGYEQLHKINSRLVYATNTGYGLMGSLSKPCFDMTVQSLTGLMSRLGEPGQPPVYLGLGSGDHFGALLAALGILIALRNRRRTGVGQRVDASLYGAQLFLAAPFLQEYLATESERFSKQQSRTAPENPLWNLYQARDRWLFLCLENTDENFAKLCTGLDAPGLAEDARFGSPQDRAAHSAELVGALEALIAARPAGEWTGRWRAQGIPVSPICTYADVAEDTQVLENEYLLETYSAQAQRDVTVRGHFVGLSRTPGQVRALGPELSQDTEILLTELLGYSWEEVAELKEDGVIF
jgi:crotonobetainyl-CoA:carnitine CoA-transferase CaiB-like acyl-CoA transferase